MADPRDISKGHGKHQLSAIGHIDRDLRILCLHKYRPAVSKQRQMRERCLVEVEISSQISACLLDPPELDAFFQQTLGSCDRHDLSHGITPMLTAPTLAWW